MLDTGANVQASLGTHCYIRWSWPAAPWSGWPRWTRRSAEVATTVTGAGTTAEDGAELASGDAGVGVGGRRGFGLRPELPSEGASLFEGSCDDALASVAEATEDVVGALAGVDRVGHRQERFSWFVQSLVAQDA